MEAGIEAGIEAFGAAILIGNIVAIFTINYEGEFPRGTATSMAIPFICSFFILYGIILGGLGIEHFSNIIGIWTFWVLAGGFIAIATVGIKWISYIFLYPFYATYNILTIITQTTKAIIKICFQCRYILQNIYSKKRVRIPPVRKSDE